MFLRLYLVLLSEFVDQLRDLAGLLEVKVQKPPPDVCLWANRWAKHRLGILVQHHPFFVFADSYGQSWKAFFASLASSQFTDPCGPRYALEIIDTEWLRKRENKAPDLIRANGNAQAVIAVPPLEEFLLSTIRYFRHVIDSLLASPEAVKRFELQRTGSPCFGVQVFD